MTGASLSLVDFVHDALRELQQNDDDTKSRLRTVAIILALLPPCAIALGFKDVFLVALEEAGLLGGVSLYGIIPALCSFPCGRHPERRCLEGRREHKFGRHCRRFGDLDCTRGRNAVE